MGDRMRLLAVGMVVAVAAGGIAAAQPAHRQVVRGEIAAASGLRPVRAIVYSTCTLADALTTWAANRGIPCDTAPEHDGCSMASAPQGILRFRFAVDRATWNGRFTLRADPAAAMQVVFRLAEGRSEYHWNGWHVPPDGAPTTGVVPSGARTADVCVIAGHPDDSTSFTYIGRSG